MILDAMTYSIITVVAIMSFVVIRLARARSVEKSKNDCEK
jgi:hypothetical protein